jgi:hypothetical protein
MARPLKTQRLSALGWTTMAGHLATSSTTNGTSPRAERFTRRRIPQLGKFCAKPFRARKTTATMQCSARVRRLAPGLSCHPTLVPVIFTPSPAISKSTCASWRALSRWTTANPFASLATPTFQLSSATFTTTLDGHSSWTPKCASGDHW